MRESIIIIVIMNMAVLGSIIIIVITNMAVLDGVANLLATLDTTLRHKVEMSAGCEDHTRSTRVWYTAVPFSNTRGHPPPKVRRISETVFAKGGGDVHNENCGFGKKISLRSFHRCSAWRLQQSPRRENQRRNSSGVWGGPILSPV